VKDTCPAYLGMPDVAAKLVEGKPTDLEALVEWREKANRMRLLLEKAVKATDADMEKQAGIRGGMTIGGWTWQETPQHVNETDLEKLHGLLGPTFYEVVTTSKTALEQLTRSWAASDRDQVLGCIRREPSGTKMARKKREADGS
jgi:hypothetical protein